MKNKIKVLTIICIIFISILLLYLWYFNPSRIFERKFGFQLPKTAKVENSDYSIFYDELCIKIKFEAADYSKILTGMEDFYKGSLPIDKDSLIPAFNATCSWWDMNKDDIVDAYHIFMSGFGPWRPKSKGVYSFITHDLDGKYFLYCVQ